MEKASRIAGVNGMNGNIVDEIIRMSNFNFERLPMLDVIAERMVEHLSTIFPDLTRVMSDVSLSSLDYIPMGEIIEKLPRHVVFAVAGGEPFEGEILLVLDQNLLMTSVELMLGGKPRQVVRSEENTREFTAIELEIRAPVVHYYLWRARTLAIGRDPIKAFAGSGGDQERRCAGCKEFQPLCTTKI